jgi:hypothetical protein
MKIHVDLLFSKLQLLPDFKNNFRFLSKAALRGLPTLTMLIPFGYRIFIISICLIFLTSCSSRRIFISSEPKGAQIRIGSKTAFTPYHLKLSEEAMSGTLTFPDGTVENIEIPALDSKEKFQSSLLKAGSYVSYGIALPLALVGAGGLFLLSTGDKDCGDCKTSDTSGFLLLIVGGVSGGYIFSEFGKYLDEKSVIKSHDIHISQP